MAEMGSRYRDVFERLRSGVAIYRAVDSGRDFILVDCNQAGEKIDNIRKEEVVGKSVGEVFPGIKDLGLLGVLQRVWETGQPESHSISLHEKQRISRWRDHYVYRLSSGEIVTVYDDVTEHKQMEEQLRQSHKMEALGRLAGGVAHDFNNLLTTILGYSDMLLMELATGDPLQEGLLEIRESAERAASLTQQLLAFSRKQIIQPAIVNINTVLANLGKMLKRLIGENIRMITRLAPNLGCIKADSGQMEQVLMNLIINARDAMPQGGTLTLETRNVYLDRDSLPEKSGVSPGEYIQLSVSDTGEGIDREELARIFEPFFTTKEGEKGTGLGLATVYGIVKQSQGHIWVYSEPERGTTFKVYFPKIRNGRPQDRRVQIPSRSKGGVECVLLVEDEKILRKLIKRILCNLGYTVHEARDGSEAVQLCHEEEIKNLHLLITDVIMPSMNGQELAERLKERYRDLKVLYISGYSDHVVIPHERWEPDTWFLQKPFSLRLLAQKVRDVLDEG